ncbi:MAG: 16S rRNA (cytidine(1402)-2'-O)-methyltransferase [Desulfobacteraceae bacterium]|nr:MAG: 16S rRNA (cytidine(1402)-2'-O)-methyltransferase [Desulfobacteraceae bacterium]
MPLNLPTSDSLQKFQAGTLYIVATPIGNLNDITFRAIETLKKVDIIAAEDTRHTRLLLSHFNITSRLISCYEHNEIESARGILEQLKAGKSVALVSNAGTPTVSDPGYRLINAVIRENIAVVPIPGVSAAITALSASGLPTDAFCFIGFLPSKKPKRRERLEELSGQPATLIFYESPRRILEVMEDMMATLGDRQAVVSRELTKTYEEFLRGTLSELIAELSSRKAIKGEITLLLSGDTVDKPVCYEDIQSQVEAELKKGGTGVLALAKKFSRSTGISKNKLYEKILELQLMMEKEPDPKKPDLKPSEIEKGENTNG